MGDDGTGKGGRERPAAASAERDERQVRLAAAMRANLRRRKEQRRAREEVPPSTPVPRPGEDGDG